MMKTDTLSFRLFLFTSLWMLFSLGVVAILVSQDYRRTVEKQFEDLITANLYNLMGSIKSDEQGMLLGKPSLGDSRYQKYKSGWYWSVSSLPQGKIILSSTSLAGQDLPTAVDVKYDAEYQRSYRLNDNAGNTLMAVEAQVFLGEGDNIFVFRTTGNLAVLAEEISNFRQRLILLLGVFGVGLVLTSLAIVRFGLKPIRLATGQLAKIRDGKANQIEGKFPREIAPLIEETNALIKSNQSIVERSRTQVGNLAHSLKTPLSVLSMEVKNLPAPLAKIVQTQLTAMNTQVQTYLNRAMISARHGTITSRADVNQTLERLVRTFNKLFRNVSFKMTSSNDEQLIFAGEQQDFEEILGNILENAGKSASANVEITARQIDANPKKLIELTILDDGPGLSKSEISYVLKRGNRLDENNPGTGLGLSIVSDILREYKGDLQINTAQSGGLRVVITLPAA
ncbi:MAG: ATP-binding protein [Rhizobiaceae bacterium]|nr:ATP-binding protein [Rhizobiaceae bacterium]